MQIFVVIHKYTKDFVCLITAENKEQAEQFINPHLFKDFELYEVAEPTLDLSDRVLLLQQLNTTPSKNIGREMEYTGVHPRSRL